MLKTIKKNILDVTSGIICHQVNCQGVMGSGLAKQLKDKWPSVFTEYKKYVKAESDSLQLCGRCQIVTIKKGLHIANLFGQYEYGTNQRHTNYLYLTSALYKLNKQNEDNHYDVYIPYGLGCGLGGGDWNVVSALIEDAIPEAIICKHE